MKILSERMKKRIPFIFLIILSSLIVIIFYGKVLFHPNNYLFNTTGDAIKNYYTYYYHIANDTSYINFQGMNYPYGEHYLYIDCHPVFSNIFHFLGQYFDNIHEYSIGFINWFMIISIFLTFLLIYFILLEFNIQKWIAVFFSIGITLLQPQIFRLTGHLALSYSICIPLTWLLLIKLNKNNNKWLYILFLLLNNLFWLFIHAYLGIIIIFFQTSFWAITMLSNRIVRKKLISYINVFFTIAFPLIYFRLFVVFTDNHLWRTDNPSGFFLYNAEPDDIIVPHHPPLRPLLDKIHGLNINLQWEAWSYIGLAFTIILIYFLILFIIQLFRKRKNELYKKYTDNTILNISLISSFFVLLFAFAFPFKIFPDLIDFIPTLKQFRATGRFDWVFFYVFTVFSVYVLYQIFIYFKDKGKFLIAYILLFVSGFFTIYEGIPYHIETSNSICQSKNLFLINNLDIDYKTALGKIDFNKYQAILPIPFFYNGSECFSRPTNNKIVLTSMLFSAYTKIPIIGAYLTRTSVSESKNIVQLISPSYYPKMIEKDIHSEKPFLIIRSNEETSEYEMDILNKSSLLLKTDLFSIYQISKHKLFENTAKNEFENFNKKKDSLFIKGDFLVKDTNAFIYFNDYENNQSDTTFRGKGSYSGIKKGKNTFAQFDSNTFSADKEYVVSAWMYNGEKDALNSWLRLMVEEFDEANNQWFTTTTFPEKSEVIYGNWSLIELKFKVKNAKNKIYIVSKGKDDSKEKLHLDDLLIRESNSIVYRIYYQNNIQILFKNNHEIKIQCNNKLILQQSVL